MRTTIDMPDLLMKRVRRLLADRNMTFRALVIDALEQAIREEAPAFRLRDAAVGCVDRGRCGVSAEAINRAIDEQRERPAST